MSFVKAIKTALVGLIALSVQPVSASVTVTVNGSSYTIPQTNEKGWGTNVTTWIQGISANTLQPTGGTFTLGADVNFGATFGLLAPYFTSVTSTPATAGAYRLAKTDSLDWRNNGNSGNLALGIDASDNLSFNGHTLVPSAGLTASRAVVTDGSGTLSAATTTSTEIGYVNGVTSNLCGINQSCTLTNKTLTAPVISTITNTGTLTLPTATDTLVGRATTDTLTNKTLSGNIALNLVSGSATNTFPTSSGQLVGITANQYGVITSGAGTGLASVIAPNSSTAFPLVSGGTSANPTWALLGVAGGGTGLASGTSGGILGYTASGVLASSGALTANQLVIGGGAGATPSSLAAGSQYQSLVMGASNPGYGAVNLAQAAAVTGALPIGNGGTGQATQAAAFNALHPMTTTGDTLYSSSGTTAARLPIGSASQVLKVVNGLPAWSTPSQGGVNYLVANPDAEVGTTGWVTYADAAQNIPVDATGGSPSSTWTRTTSSPLRGTGSFLWTRTANNRQGEGVSYDFTIDSADQARALSISFDYKNVSGTFFAADGITAPSNDGTTTQNAGNSDLEVFIYDVTNAALIPVSPQVLTCTSTTSCSYKGIFQTASNSTSYRVALHTARSTAVAFTEQFDNFFVGPQPIVQGSPVTDWTSYTPTVNTGTWTNKLGWWKRVGDSMEVVMQIGPCTANGSGLYTFSLPSGYSIDVSGNKQPSTTPSLVDTDQGNYTFSAPIGIAFGSNQGSAWYSDGATNFSDFRVYANDSTTVAIVAGGGGAQRANGMGSADGLSGSSITLQLHFSVPITGWSSTVQMSNDTDTRVVAARAHAAPGTTINSTPANPIYNTKDYDTHGGYSTSTGIYTVSVPGYYTVSAGVQLSSVSLSTSQTTQLALFKNNAQWSTLNVIYGNGTSEVWVPTGSDTLQCVAGDTIEVRASSNAATTVGGSNTNNYISIQRLSGPSAIASTDSVGANYSGQATGTLNGSVNIVTFPTKNDDSHSAYSSGTYTIPISGRYSISAQITVGGTFSVDQQTQCSIYINGSERHTEYGRAGGAVTIMTPKVSVNSVKLVAGDLVTIRSASAGSGLSYSANAAAGYFSIVRTGN